MDLSRRKRGRPRVPVTEDLIEARRVSKQRRRREQKGGSELAGPSHLSATQPTDVPVTRLGGSTLETPRQRTYIDKKKEKFAASNIVLDIGEQNQACGYCGALVWAAEFTGRHGESYSFSSAKDCCRKFWSLRTLLVIIKKFNAQNVTGLSSPPPWAGHLFSYLSWTAQLTHTSTYMPAHYNNWPEIQAISS